MIYDLSKLDMPPHKRGVALNFILKPQIIDAEINRTTSTTGAVEIEGTIDLGNPLMHQ